MRGPRADKGARLPATPSEMEPRAVGVVVRTRFDWSATGRSPDWLKSKNPACEAVRREEEEDWGPLIEGAA